MASGHDTILGAKIRVAADKAGLPIPIRAGPANQHDSAKFIGVVQDISEFADDSVMHAVVSAYAEKGCDGKCIRGRLGCHGTNCRIPYKKNSKDIARNKNQRHHGKTGFVAGRFLAWLKCGLHGTAVRCERRCGNYLSWICVSGMYDDVLEGFRIS